MNILLLLKMADQFFAAEGAVARVLTLLVPE